MINITAWFSDAENLAWLTNLVTIVGLPIALIGLFAVNRQMKNDRLAVSAGAIGAMRAGILERVERLSSASASGDGAEWEREFAELANDLELACAIYLDGQMSGRTGELARHMLCDFLDMINRDDDMREHLEAGIHATHTFRNIRDFRSKVRTDG